MMIGEPNRHANQTVHVPPWTFPDDDPTAYDASSFPYTISGISVNTNQNNADELLFSPLDALTALGKYLPSNEPDYDSDGSGGPGFETDLYQGLYACDQFRMYEFKIKKCTRARSHDWTDCPFVHPGEKARRRDPRKFHYSGTACPDFRKGACKKGDACEYAHGVFECWLHPSRYRTQPCKDGSGCRRRVCFFAHSPDQLRVLSPGGSGHQLVESYDGSPHRLAVESSCPSPVSDSLSEMVRRLQLNKVKSMPTSWGVQVGSPRFGMTRPGFSSLPNTPTGRIGGFDHFEMSGSGSGSEEEFVMQRVESGRGLRARMFEKLSRENPLDQVDSGSSGPDVGWVSELVK